MSGDVYKIMERLESRSNLGFSCHLSRQIRLPPRPGSGTGPAERQDTAESSTTLPAWCVAASGTGTRYNSVEIQRAACTLTIANAAATACSAARGNAARTATRSTRRAAPSRDTSSLPSRGGRTGLSPGSRTGCATCHCCRWQQHQHSWARRARPGAARATAANMPP